MIYHELSQLERTLPIFQIDTKLSKVRMGNYEKHDNAPRMVYLSRYIEQKVLPFVDKQLMPYLEGYYNVELHDSYSYLDTDHKKYANCLVWSKKKNDDHPILMPDIYHLFNFGDRLINHKDISSWEGGKNDKNDKIGFWGSTTGNRNPEKNDRINKCIWFHRQDSKHEISDCFITRIAQMTYPEILAARPQFPDIYTKPVTFEDQFRYKFLLDIPGNTCSWDRIPIVMNSNSLLFRFPCDDVCAFHSLFEENEHFVPVTEEDVFEKREYYLANPEKALAIITNAQAFSREFFNGDAAQRYMVGLFTGAAERRKEDEENKNKNKNKNKNPSHPLPPTQNL